MNHKTKKLITLKFDTITTPDVVITKSSVAIATSGFFYEGFELKSNQSDNTTLIPVSGSKYVRSSSGMACVACNDCFLLSFSIVSTQASWDPKLATYDQCFVLRQFYFGCELLEVFYSHLELVRPYPCTLYLPAYGHGEDYYSVVGRQNFTFTPSDTLKSSGYLGSEMMFANVTLPPAKHIEVAYFGNVESETFDFTLKAGFDNVTYIQYGFDELGAKHCGAGS
jgi:hypothetical protein